MGWFSRVAPLFRYLLECGARARERASGHAQASKPTLRTNERTDENRLLSPSLSALPHPRSGLRLRLISSRLVRLALAPRSKRFNLEHAVEPRGSAETEPQHPQSLFLFSFSLYLVANYIRSRRSRNDITIIACINIVAPRYDETLSKREEQRRVIVGG